MNNIYLEEFQSYFDSGLITKVLGAINCGKEAEVYLAEGNGKFFAIKVFKDRNERSFKNKAAYDVDLMNGHRREARALKNKSSFGLKMAEGLWRGREIQYLNQLYQAGASVPKVLGCGPNSFAMEFIGEREKAAPRLVDAKSKMRNPDHIFQKVIANLRIFLRCDLVHGDLSAFNILLKGEDDIVIIDLPQAVEIMRSPTAKDLFTRDLHNVCTFFKKLGCRCDESALFNGLWKEGWRTVVRR